MRMMQFRLKSSDMLDLTFHYNLQISYFDKRDVTSQSQKGRMVCNDKIRFLRICES